MTTILRFMLRDGALLSSSIADETGNPIDLVAEKLPEALKDLNVAAIAAAAAASDSVKDEVADLKAQLEAGKAILIAHQAESDRLANEAEAAFASGAVEKLPAIIAEAKLFGNAREKKKLLEEAAALEMQCADIAAKAAELKEKADSI